MKVVGDPVFERFQRLNALYKHSLDCVKAEQIGLEAQVHNGRPDLPNVQLHLEHIERAEDGLLVQKNSADVPAGQLRFVVREAVLGIPGRGERELAETVEGLERPSEQRPAKPLEATVPLVVVQSVDQFGQPFVAANRGAVDHAAAMDRIQMTRVSAVLRYLLEMAGDDVLGSTHELPLVRSELLDRLGQPAGRLTVRVVPNVDKTVPLFHPVALQRRAFRYFCVKLFWTRLLSECPVNV